MALADIRIPDFALTGAGLIASGRGLDARDTPILAFPMKGLQGYLRPGTRAGRPRHPHPSLPP